MKPQSFPASSTISIYTLWSNCIAELYNFAILNNNNNMNLMVQKPKTKKSSRIVDLPLQLRGLTQDSCDFSKEMMQIEPGACQTMPH